MSPLIFITCLARVTSQLHLSGVQLSSGITIASQEYADDIVQCADDIEAAHQNVDDFGVAAAPAEWHIKASKSEFLEVAQPMHTSSTSEEEVVQLNLDYSCPKCHRPFPTRRGVTAHMNFHFCPCDPDCRLSKCPPYVWCIIKCSCLPPLPSHPPTSTLPLESQPPLIERLLVEAGVIVTQPTLVTEPSSSLKPP